MVGYRSGVRIEVCILFIIVMFIAGSYTLCGCTQGGVSGVMEGISNIVDNVTQPNPSGCKSKSMEGSSSGTWNISDTFSKFFTGTQKSNFDNMGRQFSDISFLDISGDQPEPQMNDFFRGVSFSSKCCPSKYSTDSGCACLDQSKYDVIRSRGGNNVPISQL